MTRTTVATLLLGALAGCAGSHGAAQGPQVADTDFGRLGPTQTASVDEARHFVASARDELARAKLRLQEARNELSLAKADQVDASADAQRAETDRKVAEQSRAPADVERSTAMQERAKLHKSAADAHVEYANRLIQANEASVDAANKQVELADARVEWARLQALQQAGVPAATKYDPNAFQSRVASAQKGFDDALRHARELHGQASASQQRWQDAQRQLQARGSGAIQTG
jgi:hypothetical protein